MNSVLVELIDRELFYRQFDGCAPASAPLSDHAGHVVAKLLLGSLVDCAVWVVVPQVRPLVNKFLAHLRCGSVLPRSITTACLRLSAAPSFQSVATSRRELGLQ